MSVCLFGDLVLQFVFKTATAPDLHLRLYLLCKEGLVGGCKRNHALNMFALYYEEEGRRRADRDVAYCLFCLLSWMWKGLVCAAAAAVKPSEYNVSGTAT